MLSFLGAQQLENLGFVKTLPRLRALEYSEMLVTLRLYLVSLSFSVISKSRLFYPALLVVALS